MLHAVLRWKHDAFHFFGDISPYNVQTLRLHVRDRARDGGNVRARFEIDPEERAAFVKCAGPWLAHLRDGGNIVELALTDKSVPLGMETRASRSDAVAAG